MTKPIGKSVVIAEGGDAQGWGAWKVGLTTNYVETGIWVDAPGVDFDTQGTLEFVAAIVKATRLAEGNKTHGRWNKAIQDATGITPLGGKN